MYLQILLLFSQLKKDSGHLNSKTSMLASQIVILIVHILQKTTEYIKNIGQTIYNRFISILYRSLKRLKKL